MLVYMNTTYTASALRDNLADALSAVAKGGVIDVLNYTTPVARIVPAGYELAQLERITDSETAGQLIELARLTGMDSIGALLDAHFELNQRGVDTDYPEWGNLDAPPYTLDQLVLLDSLGEAAPALLGSGHPVEDWQGAITELGALGDFGSWRSRTATGLAGIAAAAGYSPAALVGRVKALLEMGVDPNDVEDMFGQDPMPEDLVAAHGYQTRELVDRLDRAGLGREQSFAMLRAGLDTDQIILFAKAGVTDPDAVAELDRAGVHPRFVARAVAEGLPVADWPRVLAPLASTVTEGRYGLQACPIRTRRGHYRLEELSVDGVPHPTRIAWDDFQDWTIPVEMIRALAEDGVWPELFRAIWRRFNWGIPSAYSPWNPARDEQRVAQVRALAKAGVTTELLDRLKTGTVRTPKNLWVSAEELVELVELAPTAAEARALAESDTNAAGWIYQLKLWRRFESEAEAFITAVREVEGVTAMLDWLAGPHPGYSKPFYGQNPIRTEAVKVFAGKKVAGTRPSYLYATTLAQALHRHKLSVPEHDEAAKRFMHQVQVFMKGINAVMAAEHAQAVADAEQLATVVAQIVEAGPRTIDGANRAS